MALGVLGVMRVLVGLMVMAAVEVKAQAPSPNILPITCNLPSTLMVSNNYCNANDEQGMDVQTQSCQGFLTNVEATPSAECCKGLNNVAYNRTACICKLTFYPPTSHNASRQLNLPSLCGVQTDLCAQCPIFLTSLSTTNNPAPSPLSNVGWSDGNSTASTVGAISLAVVFGLLLVAGAFSGVHYLIKKHRGKSNAPESFQAPPPGGAF